MKQLTTSKQIVESGRRSTGLAKSMVVAMSCEITAKENRK